MAVVNGGDKALPESVIQRIVNVLRGNTQTRGGVAVDDDAGFKTLSCWSVLASRNSGSVRIFCNTRGAQEFNSAKSSPCKVY